MCEEVCKHCHGKKIVYHRNQSRNQFTIGLFSHHLLCEKGSVISAVIDLLLIVYSHLAWFTFNDLLCVVYLLLYI